MAYIEMSEQLWQKYWVRELLRATFDVRSIVIKRYGTLYIEVYHEELPPGDYTINPLCYCFEGIKSFIIDFGIPDHFKK